MLKNGIEMQRQTNNKNVKKNGIEMQRQTNNKNVKEWD